MRRLWGEDSVMPDAPAPAWLQLRNGLMLKDADESLQYDMEIVKAAVKENWTV